MTVDVVEQAAEVLCRRRHASFWRDPAHLPSGPCPLCLEDAAALLAALAGDQP